MKWPSITVKCASSLPNPQRHDTLTHERRAREKPNLKLEVDILPKECDNPAFVKTLNDKPGILALAMDKKVDANGKTHLEALPFVVPGARFNEKYGWDSVSNISRTFKD